MTSRTRAASEGWSRRAGSALSALALVIAVLAPVAPAQAQDGMSLIRDTEIEEILHRDADPIYAAAGLDPKTVRILLVGDKELNAFATQGLMMGFNTGLILQTETPNQLKGVIAHETGHLAGAHPLRSGEMMKAGLKPMILTMGLGVLAALAGAPDAGAVLMGNASYFGTSWAPWATAATRNPARTKLAPAFWKPPANQGAAWSSSSTISATRRSSTSRGASPISAATPCRATGSTPCAIGSRSCRTTTPSTTRPRWPSMRS
jgi:hypothetical protein